MRSWLIPMALVAALLAALLAGCCGPGACGRGQDALTTAPAAATLTTSSDSGISEEVAASWGMQRQFFTDGDFEILEWEDAKAVLREQDVRGGKQYHTGWLTIYTNGGRKVLTKQPVIDAFYRFMQESGLPTTGFGTE